MTYSTIAAAIITDMVLGKETLYEEIYNPKRIPTIKQLAEKGKDYVEEFFGGVIKNP